MTEPAYVNIWDMQKLPSADRELPAPAFVRGVLSFALR